MIIFLMSQNLKKPTLSEIIDIEKIKIVNQPIDNAHGLPNECYISSEYLEYIQKKKEQEELLKTTPIQLNPFYKQKVNKYFNNLTDE